MNLQAQDLYYPQMATILGVENLTNTEKRFEIQLPDDTALGHKPGQFVEVSLFGFG